MKRKIIKSFITTISLTLMLGFSQPAAAAVQYTVQKDDSLYKIGMQFGVPYNKIQQLNHIKNGNLIFPGQKLVIPESITAEEKDLLARLVSAEAKGEPYAGKVAVATVVLNRVEHEDFPNTIKDVIYENVGGTYAFTPVMNGAINEPADEESIKAVQEALTFKGQGNDSLYFYNPKTATSEWIFSREVITQIGNHVFAK